MWREIENRQAVLDDATNGEHGGKRCVGDRVDVPGAGRAIVMIAQWAAAVVMVNNAENERHAEIQQADDNCDHAVLNHAGGNMAMHQPEVKRASPGQRRVSRRVFASRAV
jgi:hypothetical protein